jgi:hypothetical protein
MMKLSLELMYVSSAPDGAKFKSPREVPFNITSTGLISLSDAYLMDKL